MNKYFPCALVEHNDHYSIITSNFHYFEDHFLECDVGGYTINTLAKSLVKTHSIKNIKFDSEAGMFCAYSENKESLLQLSQQLREITGAENNWKTKEVFNIKISVMEADKLLINGFVKGINITLHKEFYKNVPYPPLSKKQAEWIDKIKNGNDEEIIFSARKINNEARTRVKHIENYLAHPVTMTTLIDAVDKNNKKSKVYEELLTAMVWICSRHLPDRRAEKYFIEALQHNIANVRLTGLFGLKYIFNIDKNIIPDMSNDRSKYVRNKYNELKESSYTELISWMFETD